MKCFGVVAVVIVAVVDFFVIVANVLVVCIFAVVSEAVLVLIAVAVLNATVVAAAFPLAARICIHTRRHYWRRSFVVVTCK